ncbi:MAG: hypothetical protein KDK27_14355, partial [Leptospiraceae bacterium]|nr:hypothetical protein [Leptospiraceae bacterium]
MNEEISETLVEEIPPDKSPGFPLIGIGASAGGLNAIQVLFDNMPDDTGMAFVIIQHLSPDFKSMMVELLSRHTGMQIITVQDGVRVRPNCVYLMPASKSMTIQEGRLHLQNKDRSMPLDLPIDLFFNSLGNECADQSVGVILSGTGTDGSRGIKTIKEQGGMIMVQSPDSAQFDGMPVSSIATGLADYVLGPEEMAAELIDYFQRKPGDLSGSLIAGRQETRSVLQQILALIKYQEDVDFTLYKNETILRRLEKCMNIRHISSLEAYLDFLKKHPDEVRFLYRELLIGVTSFFRDTEAWDHLESDVIPALFKDKNALETVRVWVVGCSTGEEAYSLAILLNEYIQKNKLSNDFKIFATDIDKQAIDFASAGIYHEHVVGEFNSNRFKRYFTETEGRYQISKSIRERIVFARHNVIKDPPFIRMDMITCRNLLIYIAPTVQKKIILSFEFSLKRGGYLFLGSSESLGDISKDFHTINRKWKIYVLNEKVDRPVPIVTDPERRHLPLFQRRYEPRREEHIGYQDVFSEILIERYAPSCLIINEDFEVLYLTGGVDAFLNFPRKRMNVNLLNMVNEELSLTIRNAVRRASRDEDTLVYNNVPVMHRGEKQNAVISVSSFMDHRDHRRLILVEFALEQKSESPPTNVIIDDYMI